MEKKLATEELEELPGSRVMAMDMERPPHVGGTSKVLSVWQKHRDPGLGSE